MSSTDESTLRRMVQDLNHMSESTDLALKQLHNLNSELLAQLQKANERATYFENALEDSRVMMGHLSAELQALEAHNEALKSKLANGIRVTTINHPSGLVGWMENAPAFDDKDHTNATLILDEADK